MRTPRFVEAFDNYLSTNSIHDHWGMRAINLTDGTKARGNSDIVIGTKSQLASFLGQRFEVHEMQTQKRKERTW